MFMTDEQSLRYSLLELAMRRTYSASYAPENQPKLEDVIQEADKLLKWVKGE